jgi:ribosomal protein S18 acetylase RimI-like enzyme
MKPAPAITFRTKARPSDSQAVRVIVASTAFFSAEEIDIAVELIDDRLAEGESSHYRFVFADAGDEPVAYACYGRIPGTQSSVDLYWIAVRADHRHAGIGRRLLAESERRIAAEGGTRIYVETSSRHQYEPTRQFYLRNGYTIASTLEDFYAPGDGKVTLVKRVVPLQSGMHQDGTGGPTAFA